MNEASEVLLVLLGAFFLGPVGAAIVHCCKWIGEERCCRADGTFYEVSMPTWKFSGPASRAGSGVRTNSTVQEGTLLEQQQQQQQQQQQRQQESSFAHESAPSTRASTPPPTYEEAASWEEHEI